MSAVLPRWAQPLNILQVHGTMCCAPMREAYHAKALVNNFLCYDARSIHDANLVVLWGSFSKKLVDLVLRETQATASHRVLIHLRGCDKRIDNACSTSALGALLPISREFSLCVLERHDVKMVLREARSCLKV